MGQIHKQIFFKILILIITVPTAAVILILPAGTGCSCYGFKDESVNSYSNEETSGIKKQIAPDDSKTDKFSKRNQESGHKTYPPPSDTDSEWRLNINTFSSIDMDENEVIGLSKILYSRLVSLKSREKVIYRVIDGSAKRANRTLYGRVSRLGNTQIVSVTVNDVESGKVLFNQTVKIKESNDMQGSLETVADKIASAPDIW